MDVSGERIGQVNGLTVYDLGTMRFGQPVRISATARAGDGEVIDIEREVDLGGSLHSKGVLILTSLLAGRYAQDHAFSLAASLAFEQSYGPVEGDSASMGELCALLSALAQVPVQQGIAITGSVNQNGEIQAIGGVNEKIEGFFDICSLSGLNGKQGVIIPASNARHLMLRADVVKAVRKRRFHVYAVEYLDQALELLTGLPAGAREGDADYPRGSFNARVHERLRAFAKIKHPDHDSGGQG